ncbi:hypothetical protein [Kocuria sabuli]|uniref:hypothetical protein n=1 Tax=Kocuria sabuli TaxID=3071448 RepID=UPI0034D564A8
MRTVPWARASVPAAVLLAAVQTAQALLLRAEAAYLSVPLALAAALGLAAAARLCRHRCFTARSALGMLAVLALLGEGLLVVLGLPGVGHTVARIGLPVTASAAMLGAVGVLVALHRDRRATPRTAP